MKKIRNFAISLVVLVSMLFSFQGVSQTLTFREVHGFLSSNPVYDFGSYDTLSVNTSNIDDTLFYLKFIRKAKEFKYYGIIDTIFNSNGIDSIKLHLHLETDNTYNNVVEINGVDIIGEEQYDAVSPMLAHYLKDTTIATNKKLSFDILTVFNVKFKFSFFSTSTVGFEDNFFPEKETFKLYPNPCENTLNVNADGLKRVFDTSGRLVKESYEKVIDMSDLTPGMYVVMLESGATKKVIKRN
jgi:hypothetical protein